MSFFFYQLLISDEINHFKATETLVNTYMSFNALDLYIE